MNVSGQPLELDKKSEEALVATLMYSMGGEADEIFNSYTMTAKNRKDYHALRPNLKGTSVYKGILFLKVLISGL